MLVEEEEPRLEERIEAAPTLEREGLKVPDLWETIMERRRVEEEEEGETKAETSANSIRSRTGLP